jgi:beta-lactamase regulating signal transducer with metallopeptidase domain
VTLHGTGGARGPVAASWAMQSATALYLLIAAALLMRYLRNLASVWRIRRTARKLSEPWSLGGDVRVSEAISSPATFGSTILLPAGFVEWSGPKLHVVLAHERSHVAHRDCYVLWLARLYTSVFWFSPLAWWLPRRLALLAETISDEAAVAVLNDHDRSGYAALLLEFVQRSTHPMLTAMASANLSSRIERIISGQAPSPVPTVLRRASAIVAVLCVALVTAVPVRTMAADAALEPQVIKSFSLEDLEKFYPPEALHGGINGMVKILVTLDKQGRATDTLILSEEPLDMGFGAAASTLAHQMEYSNPTGGPTQLSFNVKFQLQQQ